MNPYTVIFVIESEGIQWQFFYCRADDSDHAEEQCLDAYPHGHVLWVNYGKSQTMD